jgi:hypothetical protein
MLAPGARTVGAHTGTGATPVPLNAVSVTVGFVRVTFPVLVTRNEYVTVSPAWPITVGVTDLSSVIAGFDGAGMTDFDGGDTGGLPDGGVPVAVTLFVTEPWSTSA